MEDSPAWRQVFREFLEYLVVRGEVKRSIVSAGLLLLVTLKISVPPTLGSPEGSPRDRAL